MLYVFPDCFSPLFILFYFNLFIFETVSLTEARGHHWLDLLVSQPLGSSCLASLVLGLLQKAYLFLGNGVEMHRKNSFFMCLMLPLRIPFAQGMEIIYCPPRSVLSRSSPWTLFPSMLIAAWREKYTQVKKAGEGEDLELWSSYCSETSESAFFFFYHEGNKD